MLANNFTEETLNHQNFTTEIFKKGEYSYCNFKYVDLSENRRCSCSQSLPFKNQNIIFFRFKNRNLEEVFGQKFSTKIMIKVLRSTRFL